MGSIGQPVCDGASACSPPIWTDQQCFQCIDPDNTLDIAYGNDVGCGIGCRGFDDTPSNLLLSKVVLGGPRFLAPLTRDARGNFSDLTERSLQIPRIARFAKAPCHDNFGEECFGADSCECFTCIPDGLGEICNPSPDWVIQSSTEKCRGGEAANEILNGRRADCSGLTGHAWPISTEQNTMYCRRTLPVDPEHKTREVTIQTGALFNFNSHRDGTKTHAVNALILCSERIAGSECTSGFSNSPEVIDLGTTHYHSGHASFDILRVTSNSAMVRPASGGSTIKNKMLSEMRTGNLPVPSGGIQNFQQLDRQGLGYWFRDYNPVGLPLSSLRLIEEFPTSYLLQSGVTVPCSLRLRRAKMECHIIAHKEQTSFFPLSLRPNIVPYARIRIRVEGVLVLDEPQGYDGTIIRPWLPDTPLIYSVRQGTDNYPIVSGDRLIVRGANVDDSGPPFISEWWGMLGAFSHPSVDTETVNLSTGLGGITAHCNLIRDALSVGIPAWPYSFEELTPADRQSIYGGSVSIGF